jgi:hypothetical protein
MHQPQKRANGFKGPSRERRRGGDAKVLRHHATGEYHPERFVQPVKEELPVFIERDDDFDRIVNADYQKMLDTNVIAVTPHVRKLMLMRSIPGHANSGHALFNKHGRYPNADISDVLEALGDKAVNLRKDSQQIIDDIEWWVKIAMKDPYDRRLALLCGPSGEPLGGAEMFRHSIITEPINVLQGMYMGGRMDNYDTWRLRVKERFQISLGGGRGYAINRTALNSNDLTMEDLSKSAHTNADIDALIKKGIILDSDEHFASKTIVNGYVRREIGKGVSDDAAMVTAGIKYGMHAALGLLLIDAIDTWDKSSTKIVRAGQDERLADFILTGCRQHGHQIEHDPGRVEEFIYLSAIDPVRKTLYPDCSQRRFFIQSTRGDSSPYYAALLHIEFIKRMREGRDLKGLNHLHIGFAGVPSEIFYNAYAARFKEAHEKELIKP